MITAGLQSLGKFASDRRLKDEDPFEAGKSSAIKQDTGFGGARVYGLWLAYSALRHLMQEVGTTRIIDPRVLSAKKSLQIVHCKLINYCQLGTGNKLFRDSC